jgi:thimet oligopeptidase
MNWRIPTLSAVLLTGTTALAQKKPPVYAPLPEIVPLSARPQATPPVPVVSLAELQARAATFKNRLTLPDFETSPAAIQAALDATLATCNTALDRVAALPPDALTFSNTIAAMDDISFEANRFANRIYFIKETSPDAAVREAATGAVKKFQDWAVGLDYREDVYRSLKAFAATQPKLSGEQAKLMTEVLRDYRRAGLDLPKSERDEIESLRKKLAARCTDFDLNVNQAEHALKFTKTQLAGVPESILSQPAINTGKDEYTLKANVTWQALAVLENGRLEESRRRMETARANLAKESNTPVLEEILTLRSEIARRLGYRSWADYVIEVKMAKTASTAIEFLEKLESGLQPKFAAELAELQKLKARDTRDKQAKIELWDWRYYAEQLRKERFNVDAEQLRVYFPMQRAVEGMFTIYQRIFAVTFTPVTPPFKWIGDLELYCVADTATGEPLGFFYLDMYPREGKYNHFAVFTIVDGKRLAGGEYQRPVVALVCNFPPATPDQPSLLKHSDVETLFHEFGHAMHNILTRASYSRFAGANVPRDFVEAPSQMLEAWVWDKAVLDSFAADYRDTAKKIPADILDQLKAARLATMGCFYRRQLSFGMMDLALHTQITPANASNAIPLANAVLSQVFLPVPPGSAFPCYFGHLTGYDAGYYGYAWAKAIASDMASPFEQAPEGFMDRTVGRRLRDEIYAVGDSRDVSESIQAYLGREPSIEPFLKEIGVSKTTPATKKTEPTPPKRTYRPVPPPGGVPVRPHATGS